MASEIWHHGIKGQRWGVRRTPEQLGHVVGKQKAGSHPDHNQIRAKKTSEMSNAELKEALTRLRSEDEYSRLLKNQENNKAKSKAQKAWALALAAAPAILKFTSTALALDNNITKIMNKVATSNADTAAQILADFTLK